MTHTRIPVASLTCWAVLALAVSSLPNAVAQERTPRLEFLGPESRRVFEAKDSLEQQADQVITRIEQSRISVLKRQHEHP